MLDETRIIYGLNGRNHYFVQNKSSVKPLKIKCYAQLISSAIALKHCFVRQNDGVSFGSDLFFKYQAFLIKKLIVFK